MGSYLKGVSQSYKDSYHGALDLGKSALKFGKSALKLSNWQEAGNTVVSLVDGSQQRAQKWNDFGTSIGNFGASIGNKIANWADHLDQVTPQQIAYGAGYGTGIFSQIALGNEFSLATEADAIASSNFFRAVSGAELADIGANGFRIRAGGYETF